VSLKNKGDPENIDNFFGNQQAIPVVFLARKHKNEFIPAETANSVPFPKDFRHFFRNSLQQLIPDMMTEGIIDPFEFVKVEHHEGHLHSVSVGLAHSHIKTVDNKHSIRQAGQMVMIGETQNLPLQFFLGRDVLNGKKDDPFLPLCRLICRAFKSIMRLPMAEKTCSTS